jgi:glycosyltransferase involved in cell wall biosynthesis
MVNRPCISVIIPLYNKEKTIKNTIESVLSQSYTDFELIIVNDGSTDGSAEKVALFHDRRIRFIHKENGGVSSARNYGLKEAKGEWVLFLDADDKILPHCLQMLYALAEKYQIGDEVEIVSGNYYRIYKGKKSIYSTHKYEGIVKNNAKWYFFNKYSLRTGVALIKRNLMLKNLFMENLSRFEDLEVIIRLLPIAKIVVTHEIIFEYNNVDKGLSRKSNDVRCDFTFNMDFSQKNFWTKCILGELLFLSSFTYPEQKKYLKSRYSKYYIYRYISLLIKRMYKIIHRF